MQDGEAAGRWPVTVLPYGVVQVGQGPPRPATAIGDEAVDLAGLARDGFLDGALAEPVATFEHASLDRFLAAGRATWQAVRARLAEVLADPSAADRLRPHRTPLRGARPVLPWTVADYVDFYSSRDHATNVGRIFRPDDAALPPAWDHLPIGYHGRAGTVVVSGTPIVRPSGLSGGADGGVSAGPSRHLDVEVELGWVVGVGSPLGTPLTTDAFAEHVIGAVLVNDWSARDLQAFEYRPLGPFLGKSFATSISPWIVPLDALDAARVAPPAPPHPPTPHLAPAGDGYAIDLELSVRPAGAATATVLSRPRAAGLRWTPAQQLAHLTSNGASSRTGDLYASGTVSGPTRHERGCLLELSWGWREEVPLDGGGDRRHGLEDGDTVTIRGSAPLATGGSVALGEVVGTVLPAR